MYAPADDEEQPTFRARVDYGTRVAITIAAAAVLFLGIMPGGMLDFAKHASQMNRPGWPGRLCGRTSLADATG